MTSWRRLFGFCYRSLISEDQNFDIVGNLEEAYENFTIQDDIIDADDDENADQNLILESGFKFSEMKITMEAVSEYMHKVIKSPGIGETVPSTARVTVEYTVYLEGDIKPFDTSFLKQEKFVRFHQRNLVISLFLYVQINYSRWLFLVRILIILDFKKRFEQ